VNITSGSGAAAPTPAAELPAGLAADARAQFLALQRELAQSLSVLPDKSEETAFNTLCALWSTASGIPISVQRAASAALRPLAPAELDSLRNLIQRRAQGVPLAHLSGRQAFMGLELIASPDALIPRQETTLLGAATCDAAREISHRNADRNITVLDVCTGSGNLALAIASTCPRAHVWGADLSTSAVDLANRNATFTGLDTRVRFRAGDLLTPFDNAEFLGTVDLLVCNPPYISTPKVSEMPDEISRHEPSLAFDGGPLGIRILMRLIAEAPRFLRSGGVLAFEVGLGQGRGVLRKLDQAGHYTNHRELKDHEGNTRALVTRFT
jgi:release factor glutamine methyltransferase